MTKFRTVVLTLAVVGAATLLSSAPAQAGDFYGGAGYRGARSYSQAGRFGGCHAGRGYSGNRGYRTSHYHAPSVHYHRKYHADYYHWTPRRGLHSHGHYDSVPHYTPGYRHW